MTKTEKIVIMDVIANLNEIRQRPSIDDDIAYSVGYTARRLQRIVDDFDDYIDSLRRKEEKNA